MLDAGALLAPHCGCIACIAGCWTSQVLPALGERCRAFGDMEFKGQEGLQLLLQKGLDFGLWDQKFADSR